MSLLVDAWARWMLETSLACAAVFLVVALLWRSVRRWSSAHTGSWLMLLPLLCLLVPLGRLLPHQTLARLPGAQSMSAAVSDVLAPSAPRSTPVVASTEETRPTVAVMGEGSGGPLPVGGEQATSTQRWPLRDLLFVAWAAVVAILLGAFLRNQLRVRALLRRARTVDPADLGLRLDHLTRRAGLHRPVRLALTDDLASPATWGVWRPVVLIPRALLPASPQALSWLVLHELAHQRRKDLLVTAVQQLLQIGYFFHPFVWITNRVVSGLRERACDDAALARRVGRDRLACAAVFLEVLEGASRRRPAPRGLPLLLDHRVELRRRMMNLLDSRHCAPRGVTRGSLAVLLAGTLLAAPAAAWLTAPLSPAPTTEADQATHIPGLAAALTWLKSQQHPDGHWDAGPDVQESGEFNEVGMTGLSILALLEGTDADVEHRKETAAKGLSWLHAIQGEEGRFGTNQSYRHQPSHAIATLAWLKGQALVAPDTWTPAAQKAVDYILKSQNPYKGWRFVPKDGDNDSFITGLMLWALQDARTAGLEVPTMNLEWGYSFLDEMLDPETGRTGYSQRGGMPARLVEKIDTHPAEYSEYPTALGLFVRSRDSKAGKPGDVRAASVDLLSRQKPDWDTTKGSIDFYYWWFGAKALARVDEAAATTWHAALTKDLLAAQAADGSWPAADAWSAENATVHSTALCALALAASS